MTPEETAAHRVAEVLAERDAIQANLLEPDGSFARRVLDGAALTGQTRDRWAASSAALSTLRETFLAYPAVVGRAAALGSGARRPARRDLPEFNALLTGGCVQLPGAPRPACPQEPRGGRASPGDAGRRRRRDAPCVHRGGRGDLGGSCNRAHRLPRTAPCDLAAAEAAEAAYQRAILER